MTLLKNKLNIINLKALIFCILMLTLIFSLFTITMSWAKGKEIDELIDTWISHQNNIAKKGTFISTKSASGLFDRRYQISYVQVKEGTNQKIPLIESDIKLAYGPIQKLFKDGDISIDLSLEVTEPSNLMMSALDNNTIKNLLLNSFKFNSKIEGKATLVYDPKIGLKGDFKTLNLPNAAISDSLQFKNITGTVLINTESLTTHVTIDQPNIKLLSKIEPTATNQDKRHIPQVVFSTTEIGNIDNLRVSFNLDQTANLTDFQFFAKNASIDDLVLDDLNIQTKMTQDKESLLVGLESTLSSSSIIFTDKLFGNLSMNVVLGNIDLNLINKIVDTAHKRFELDTINEVNKFPLSVYYFTQWLQNKEIFLQNQPFLSISQFKVNGQDSNLTSSLKWQFQPSGQKTEFYINPLITSIINHTQLFAFDMVLNHYTLKEIISTMFSLNEENQIETFLFAMNEMNKTKPFLQVGVQQSNEKLLDNLEEPKVLTDLLNPNAVVKFNVTLNALTDEVTWLGEVFKFEEFRIYLNHLNDQY